MYGIIYKISNTINNKVYIGQTRYSLEHRFTAHKKKAMQNTISHVHLHEAMRKYGVDNFYIEQIDIAETPEELNQKEIYWIAYYNSFLAGYNMTPGGTESNPMDSEIVKQKHLSRIRSQEVREKISKTLHDLRTTVGFSEEHRKKISEAMKGNHNFGTGDTRSLGVYCILISGEKFEFHSILDAGKWWYENYKPFGEIYSTATYRRKIEASIAGKEIEYGNKNHTNYKKITNIKWYWNNKEVMSDEVN